MDSDEQTLQKAIDNLPSEIRKYIFSQELKDEMLAIGKKFNLHVDETGSLITEVMVTLAGVQPLEKFKDEIKYVILNKQQLPQIIQEIEDAIFKKVNSKLRESTEGVSANGPKQSSPTQQSGPALQAQSSVVEAKMSMTEAPKPVQQIVAAPTISQSGTPAPTQPTTIVLQEKPKESKPAAPEKYHGRDPYLEPAE